MRATLLAFFALSYGATLISHAVTIGIPGPTWIALSPASPGAARFFRHELVRISLASGGDNVGCGERHGAAVRGFMSAEDDSAVVGGVQPLMGVRRIRIGVLDAADQGGALG